jgi:hypothetical protein
VDALGPLSLPEAMAIMEGARVDAHELVFLGLLELVARGGASIVHGGDEYALVPRERSRLIARPLLSLFDVLVEGRAESPEVRIERAPGEYVNRRWAIRWGTAENYVRREVWTSLEQRALLSTTPTAWDMFVVDAWHLTETGEAERQRLRMGVPSQNEWQQRPATILLTLHGLPVPDDETFEAVDEVEELITPGQKADWTKFLDTPGVS